MKGSYYTHIFTYLSVTTKTEKSPIMYNDYSDGHTISRTNNGAKGYSFN